MESGIFKYEFYISSSKYTSIGSSSSSVSDFNLVKTIETSNQSASIQIDNYNLKAVTYLVKVYNNAGLVKDVVLNEQCSSGEEGSCQLIRDSLTFYIPGSDVYMGRYSGIDSSLYTCNTVKTWCYSPTISGGSGCDTPCCKGCKKLTTTGGGENIYRDNTGHIYGQNTNGSWKQYH